MKIIIILFCLTSFSAFGETLKGNYELQNSKIEYLVKYLIKKADGESVSAKGKGICSEKKCEFLVAAPVKTFVSRDSNRDLKMLNTVKVEKNPMVSAMISTEKEVSNNILLANLEVDFAGVKKTYEKIPFEFKKTENGFEVNGKFDLMIDSHNVEKPSLLGVEIDNLVPIKIQANWISK